MIEAHAQVWGGVQCVFKFQFVGITAVSVIPHDREMEMDPDVAQGTAVVVACVAEQRTLGDEYFACAGWEGVVDKITALAVGHVRVVEPYLRVWV